MVQWVWQNGSRVYTGLVLFLGVRLSMESKSGFYEDSFFLPLILHFVLGLFLF